RCRDGLQLPDVAELLLGGVPLPSVPPAGQPQLRPPRGGRRPRRGGAGGVAPPRRPAPVVPKRATAERPPGAPCGQRSAMRTRVDRATRRGPPLRALAGRSGRRGTCPARVDDVEAGRGCALGSRGAGARPRELTS